MPATRAVLALFQRKEEKLNNVNCLSTQPRLVKATSIGSEVLRNIPKHREVGYVASVFRSVMIIMATNGKAMFVGGSSISNGPINIVTNVSPSHYMTSLGIKVGMKVTRRKNSLEVGGIMVISLDDSKTWRPRKATSRKILSISHIKNNLRIATELAHNKGRHEGLGLFLKHVDEIVSVKRRIMLDEGNQFAQTTMPAICSLIKAIKENDLKSLRKCVELLAGLGPGLSPSADDMLAGLMEAMYFTVKSMRGNLGCVNRLNQFIITSTEGKTSLLSQQLLEQASRGDVAEVIENVVEAILTTSVTNVESSINKILRLGANSGTDTTLGLILGIHLSIDSLALHKV